MKELELWRNLQKDPEKEQYISHVKRLNPSVNAFLDFDESRISNRITAQDPSKGSVSGLPFAVKDNIAVKDFQLSCGSQILHPFISPYSATAVTRLLEAGAYPIAKTNLDEFGMGSSNEHSIFGPCSNPWNLEYVAGGSSGGSAAAVAAGFVPFALGSDTGGSIRQPASFCGIFGLKPTYGTISRYGLVAYASSLDVIGIVSRDIDIISSVFSTVRSKDPNDQTSVEYVPLQCSEGPLKIGVIDAPDESGNWDPEVLRVFQDSVSRFKDLGYTCESIELPILQYVIPAYYTIATAEASANLARYTGVRYGFRAEDVENVDDLVRKTRTEGFGEEVKKRILLGTYVLRSGFQDQYYIRAQKIRTAIIQQLDEIYKSYDLVLMPTFPVPSFKHGDAVMTEFQQKLADKYTATANLSGFPALSIPAGFTRESQLPIGIQLMGPAFSEERLYTAARDFNFPVDYPDRLNWG